jgi:hypothetical protein
MIALFDLEKLAGFQNKLPKDVRTSALVPTIRVDHLSQGSLNSLIDS